MNFQRFFRHSSLCLLLLAVVAGCGSKLSEITGNVTVAGKAVEKGSVSFLPADGHGPTAGAIVKGGQYRLRIMPGKYKVQILGFRKVGQRRAEIGNDSSPMVDDEVQTLPARYNTATTLTRDVAAGQAVDFALD